MKFQKFFAAVVSCSALMLTACGGGGSSECVGPDCDVGPEGEGRALNLQEVYTSLRIVGVDDHGLSVSYKLYPESGYVYGINVDNYLDDYSGEYEVRNLGNSTSGEYTKIQDTVRVYENNRILSQNSTVRSYSQEGELKFITFSDTSVTGIVTQTGTLPTEIGLNEGPRSGTLNQVDYSNGNRSTATWQWLGQTEGYYVLMVTEQFEYGNDAASHQYVTYEYKYYITSDGYVPQWSMKWIEPDSLSEMTFRAYQTPRSMKQVDGEGFEAEVSN